MLNNAEDTEKVRDRLALLQQRCVVLNHAGTIKRLNDMIDADNEAKAQLEQAKQAKKDQIDVGRLQMGKGRESERFRSSSS